MESGTRLNNNIGATEFMQQRRILLEESEGQGKFSCSSACRNLCDIFKKVYQRRSYSTSQEKTLLSFLRLRAWIAHSLYTALRLYNWVAGQSAWQKKNISKSCLDDDQVAQAASPSDVDESSSTDCISLGFRDDFLEQV